MKCLYCEENDAIKYSKYASGNFCGKICAKKYSSNFNKKEANAKISKTLKLLYPPKLHKCKNKKCRKMVLGYKNKYCSDICKNSWREKYKNDPEYTKKLSEARIRSILNGNTNFNSIKCEYKFGNKIIKCDSKIEYSCLDYFEKNYNVINMQRNIIAIQYKFQNKIKLFLPDFKIETDAGTFIVEAKSDIVGSKLNKKWHFHKETSKFKKLELIKFCKINNLIPFWYTKKLNRKFYNSLKF